MRAVEGNLGHSLPILEKKDKKVFGGPPHIGTDQSTMETYNVPISSPIALTLTSPHTTFPHRPRSDGYISDFAVDLSTLNC